MIAVNWAGNQKKTQQWQNFWIYDDRNALLWISFVVAMKQKRAHFIIGFLAAF